MTGTRVESFLTQALLLGLPQESLSQKMQAVVRHQRGGHGPRRSMRRVWKLGMIVRQLVLSCTPSS